MSKPKSKKNRKSNKLNQEGEQQNTKKKGLSQLQRIMLLEEKVNFIYDALKESEKSNIMIMKGLSKIIEQNKKDKGEISQWAEIVEERLGKLVVQQTNLHFIFETLFPLTPEQEKVLTEKAEELKKKRIKEKINTK